MSTARINKAALESVDLDSTAQRQKLQLSEIVRKRRLPLLMIVDEFGDLVFSSVPENATAEDQRLLMHSLIETHSLFHRETKTPESADPLIVDEPGERCALVQIENEFFSLKLFPLQEATDNMLGAKYAALVEPIVQPLAEGIDFGRVKDKWRLANREVDVVKALMSGATDKEIARMLEVSVETVRAYLKSIRAKLGVATRTAIVHVVHLLHSDEHHRGTAVTSRRG